MKVLEAAREYAQQMSELARHLPRRAGFKLRADRIKTSRSIGAKIAEGFGRGTTAEKIHYSRMADGSLEERQAHLREWVNTHLIDSNTFLPAVESLNRDCPHARLSDRKARAPKARMREPART